MTRAGATPARGPWRAVGLGLAAGAMIAGLTAGCVVRYVLGPRLTGTCGGACAHYLDCRHGDDDSGEVRRACLHECPDVFGDRDSLMAFESLSCRDTVEYVEGPDHHPPGQHGPGGGTATGASLE